MAYDRRTVLQLAGLTAAGSTAALAGCTGMLSSDDHPEYESWVGTEDDGVYFAYADWGAFEEVDELEDDPEEADDEDVETEDPMLDAPMSAGIILAWSVGFGLAGTGLTPLVDEDDDDLDSEADEVIVVEGGFALLGDVDDDEIEARLADDEDGFAFEATAEYEGYEIYEPLEDEDAFVSPPEVAIGVTGDAIVLADGEEPVADLEAIVDVEAGEGERGTEAYDTFAWLLEEAGHGQLAIGVYDGDDDVDDEDEVDDETVEDATGLVASFSLESDGGASADFAATFDEIDDETEAELETELGQTATEVDLEIDDGRVTASATWDDYGDELE